MTCETFARMLDSYADLSDEEKNALQEHTKVCEGCAKELNFMQSMLDTVKSLPPIEPPGDFLEDVNFRLDHELIAEGTKGYFLRRSKTYAIRYASIAACAAVAAVIGLNADNLLTKMNSDTSGVIVESTGTDDIAESVLDTQGIENTEAGISSGDENITATEGSPVVTDIAADTASAAPTPSANVTALVSKEPTPTPLAKTSVNVSTANTSVQKPTNVNNDPSSGAAAASNHTAAPQGDDTVADPQPAAESTGIAAVPSEVPIDDALPAASSAQSSESETSSAEVYVQDVISPSPAGGSGSYTAQSRAAADDEYAVSITSEMNTADTTAYSGSDYTIDDSQADSDYTYAPLSSILAIKEKNAVRAQEVIDVFISETYRNYYKITAVDLKNLLAQLDREGIWYDLSRTDSSDTTWFRILVIQD